MMPPPEEAGSEPPRPTQALFLERQSYRRRRLVDVARLLPLLGVLLLLVPLLWQGKGEGLETPISTAITYVFAVWALLILGAGLFGIAARRWGGDKRADTEE
ncbi:MAG: hypothetical protein L3J36_16135 [Rhodobacteraceae bacterium]|nr:hypothetical protein [Paracoccaceae bacterium]